MSFSISQASLRVFDISLNALSAILDKAEAHAVAKNVDSSVLLHSRLSPDMFARVRQVQIATDHAKSAVVNGVMYVLSTGCQWRYVPKEFPSRSTVNRAQW